MHLKQYLKSISSLQVMLMSMILVLGLSSCSSNQPNGANLLAVPSDRKSEIVWVENFDNNSFPETFALLLSRQYEIPEEQENDEEEQPGNEGDEKKPKPTKNFIGLRINCGSIEETSGFLKNLLDGMGLSPNPTFLRTISLEEANKSKFQNQPLLNCPKVRNPQNDKMFVEYTTDSEEGEKRYYLQFKEPRGRNKYFWLGCKDLLEPLGFSDNNINPYPFSDSSIHKEYSVMDVNCNQLNTTLNYPAWSTIGEKRPFVVMVTNSDPRLFEDVFYPVIVMPQEGTTQKRGHKVICKSNGAGVAHILEGFGFSRNVDQYVTLDLYNPDHKEFLDTLNIDGDNGNLPLNCLDDLKNNQDSAGSGGHNNEKMKIYLYEKDGNQSLFLHYTGIAKFENTFFELECSSIKDGLGFTAVDGYTRITSLEALGLGTGGRTKDKLFCNKHRKIKKVSAKANYINILQQRGIPLNGEILWQNEIICMGRSRKCRNLPLLKDPQDVATGNWHACALDQGKVVCWGVERYIGSENKPNFTNPKGVLIGGKQTCVVDKETNKTSLKCWSKDNGSDTDVPEHGNIKKIPTGARYEVAIGSNHGCLIDNIGVKCWGSNDNQQLNVPVGLVNPRYVAVANDRSCVIDDTGLVCWGGSYQQSPTMAGIVARKIRDLSDKIVSPIDLIISPSDICIHEQNLTINCIKSFPFYHYPLDTVLNVYYEYAGKACVIDYNGIRCEDQISFEYIKVEGKSSFDISSIPTGGDTGPTGGDTDPSGGGTDPTGGDTEPTGGDTDPTGGGTDPTGGDTDPAGGDTDPTGGGSGPSGGTADVTYSIIIKNPNNYFCITNTNRTQVEANGAKAITVNQDPPQQFIAGSCPALVDDQVLVGGCEQVGLNRINWYYNKITSDSTSDHYMTVGVVKNLCNSLPNMKFVPSPY